MNEALKELTPEEELIVCYTMICERFPDAEEKDIFTAANRAVMFNDPFGTIRKAESLHILSP